MHIVCTWLLQITTFKPYFFFLDHFSVSLFILATYLFILGEIYMYIYGSYIELMLSLDANPVNVTQTLKVTATPVTSAPDN